MTDALLTRYRERLFSIPMPGGGGCHISLLGIANLGTMAGLDPETIFHDIRRAIPCGGRKVTDREIADAIVKALNDHKFERYRTSEPIIKNGERALQGIIKQAKIANEVDLWEASPIRLDGLPGEDAAKFLFAMYEPQDLIFIGERHEGGILGRTIRTAAQWIKYFENGGKSAPLICINPLNGLPGEKKSGVGMTLRGDSNVKDFRYCMAEFDQLSRENQVRFWTAAKLPVVCLIDTGGKSIHAWIDILRLANIQTPADWQKEIKHRLYDQGLIPLGVDSACSNPARLSRLPGHFREEKNNFQRLLWLAEPQQDGKQ